MVDDDRLKEALQKGEDAFWEAVAAQFPEAETGDLAPDASYDLRRSMERAIRAWISANIFTDEDEALKP